MWVDCDGTEMTDEDWTSPHIRCLAVIFVGRSSDVLDDHGHPITGQSFMLLFNAHHEPVKFVLAGREGIEWECLLDTREEAGFLSPPTLHAAADEFEVEARSTVVFQLARGNTEDARAASWKPREQPVAD